MAKFNLELTVPDDKVNELKQMIDERMNSAYGFIRKTTVTNKETGEQEEVENYGYLEWMEVLIKEMLRANYKGWKKSKADEATEEALQEEINLIIS